MAMMVITTSSSTSVKAERIRLNVECAIGFFTPCKFGDRVSGHRVKLFVDRLLKLFPARQSADDRNQWHEQRRHNKQHHQSQENNHQGFDQFVRTMLMEILPTCYLEGYQRLNQQVQALPWPENPRFIFTSNNFDTDEIL